MLRTYIHSWSSSPMLKLEPLCQMRRYGHSVKETIYHDLSVTSPIYLSLGVLVNTRCPNYFNSSSHGVRWLEQRMNSSSCHRMWWVVDPSIRTMTSLRRICYLLSLRGDTIEGIDLKSRNITSRCRNPQSQAIGLVNNQMLNKFKRTVQRPYDHEKLG
jgi:hypothetical protein